MFSSPCWCTSASQTLVTCPSSCASSHTFNCIKSNFVTNGDTLLHNKEIKWVSSGGFKWLQLTGEALSFIMSSNTKLVTCNKVQTKRSNVQVEGSLQDISSCCAQMCEHATSRFFQRANCQTLKVWNVEQPQQCDSPTDMRPQDKATRKISSSFDPKLNIL